MQTLPNAAFKNVPTTFKKSATTALHCLRGPPVKLTCSEHRLRLRSERVFCNQKCAMTVCTAVSVSRSRYSFFPVTVTASRESAARACELQVAASTVAVSFCISSSNSPHQKGRSPHRLMMQYSTWRRYCHRSAAIGVRSLDSRACKTVWACRNCLMRGSARSSHCRTSILYPVQSVYQRCLVRRHAEKLVAEAFQSESRHQSLLSCVSRPFENNASRKKSSKRIERKNSAPFRSVLPFASFELVAPTKFDSARKLVESKVSSRKHMLQAGCFRTVTLCLLLAELFSDIVAKKLFSTKSAEVSLRRGLLVCVAVSVHTCGQLMTDDRFRSKHTVPFGFLILTHPPGVDQHVACHMTRAYGHEF